MEIRLCEKEECTGCGSCVAKCPLNCIEFSLDELDNVYPKINIDKCAKCGSCVKVCPSIKENQIVLNAPIKAYAVWNKNSEIRRKSASGGAAAG